MYQEIILQKLDLLLIGDQRKIFSSEEGLLTVGRKKCFLSPEGHPSNTRERCSHRRTAHDLFMEEGHNKVIEDRRSKDLLREDPEGFLIEEPSIMRTSSMRRNFFFFLSLRMPPCLL